MSTSTEWDYVLDVKSGTWTFAEAMPPLPVETKREMLRAITTRQPWLNISTRRVGGLRFIKIGRLCLSFCVTKGYRPL